MKAIIFDLDDTLYDRKLPFMEAFFQLTGIKEESQCKVPMNKIHEAFVKRGNEVFDASEKGEITMEEMYIYRFRKGMEDVGMLFTDEQALEFQKLYEIAMKNIHLSDEVQTMLEELWENGVRMGIITNGPSGHQRDKMHALHIDTWIPEELWVISGDYNAPKPDPLMYRIMEKKLHSLSEELLYVGDSYERDILGAIRAGWKTLYLQKKVPDAETLVHVPEQRPDAVVKSEKEMHEKLCEMIYASKSI